MDAEDAGGGVPGTENHRSQGRGAVGGDGGDGGGVEGVTAVRHAAREKGEGEGLDLWQAIRAREGVALGGGVVLIHEGEVALCWEGAISRS